MVSDPNMRILFRFKPFFLKKKQLVEFYSVDEYINIGIHLNNRSSNHSKEQVYQRGH